MIKTGNSDRPRVSSSKARFSTRLRWVSGLLLASVLLALAPTRALAQDDEYLQIYELMRQAASLQKQGNADAAKAKYEKARVELQNLKLSYPTWNPGLVSFRLNDLARKIAALSQPPPLPPEKTSPTNQPPETSTGAPPAAAPSSPRVQLLDAGAEPRTVLRLQVQPGEKQTVALTMKFSMGMQMGDAPAQEMKMPAMTMIMEATVKNVSTNGDIAYDLVTTDVSATNVPGAMPQLVDAMKTMLAGFKGMTISGVVSDRGLSRGFKVKLPPGLNPQLRQTLGQMNDYLSNMTAPLPVEAVGRGARWKVDEPIKSQGMTVDQTMTYTLVSADTTHYQAKVSMEQQAKNQTIRSPAMPTLKVDVSKMSGSGSGTNSSDLTRLLPTQATMDGHSEIHMGMNAGGQKRSMVMKITTAIQLEQK